MAIDLLIFGLLLVSFAINLLALGAFWVTPSLRTTANRFTINLLIINLIGCLILAPTLFISAAADDGDSGSGLISATPTVDDDSIEFYSKPGNHQMTIRHNGHLVEKEGVILRRNASRGAGETIETIFKCNTTYCQELTIDEGSETIVITEIEEENLLPPPSTIATAPPLAMRSWSIDMAAALGALAVLLVVGDTWCAITDPLRYHSRVSGLKAWVFIALTWVVGVLFGALSAFRDLSFESDTFVGKQRRFVETYLHLSSASSIFGLVFACVYFVVIILLPFGFVCGMYWRIFSEARENGLRMRQNGSSPLLQSALNLTHQSHAHQQQQQQQQYTNSLFVHRNSVSSASSHGGGGLHMQIDQQQPQSQSEQQKPLPTPPPTQRKASPACMRRDSAAKVLLPTISDDGCSDDIEADVDTTIGQLMPVLEAPDRNQSILLTLQTASGEIKRNYSARQLPLLGNSSQDLREAQHLKGIRLVHSSPNLHKYTLVRQDSLSDEGGVSPHHLDPLASSNTPPPHRHYIQAPHNSTHNHHSHVLQIPAIHASPKAISYMSSLRHRLSNASSLFKYREESRAARISILVVIMFLVSYLPYGFLVLLQSRLGAANFPHSTQLAIVMILLANLSSPFIFAYRNKRVRRGVKRLFGLDVRCRTLHRESSASGKCSSFLRRQMGHTHGASAHIKRNGSRVSTYSSNSGKYLTPQSSLVSNAAPGGCCSVPVHRGTNGNAPPPLRHNSSCCTIINFAASNEGQATHSQAVAAAEMSDTATTSSMAESRSSRPRLQRGITIVEQIPVASKFDSRRSIFQMFFPGSPSLGCSENGGDPTSV